MGQALKKNGFKGFKGVEGVIVLECVCFTGFSLGPGSTVHCLSVFFPPKTLANNLDKNLAKNLGF